MSLQTEINLSGETPTNPDREALREQIADHRFLGREFLTWLIFHADESEGKIAGAHEVGYFRLIIGERARLKALGEGSGEITARGPATGQVADVRYAIAGGLTVRELDVLFERGDRIWQATIAAESFDLKRVKLPELLSEEDLERATERLELTRELVQMLRAAYAHFLGVRLSVAWTADVVPAMREWLERSITKGTN